MERDVNARTRFAFRAPLLQALGRVEDKVGRILVDRDGVRETPFEPAVAARTEVPLRLSIGAGHASTVTKHDFNRATK